MKLNSVEMADRTILSVIVAWVSYMAMKKWVWTPMKRDRNPIKREDPASPPPTTDESPLPPSAAYLPSSSAESPPPLVEKDDLASLTSLEAESPRPLEDKDDPASLTSLEAASPRPLKHKDDPASLPSSSAEPCTPPAEKHDVFLSFRGPDTRRGITTEIYLELQKRGVKAFIDNYDLPIGSLISPHLLTAIEESKFAIVLLSQNYASSPWCLEELTKIVQCMENEDRILPLYYMVEPSDVRHQKNSYEVAFKEHEEKSRHDKEKLNRWRDALKKVANVSGWDSKNFKTDRELVSNIVESVCRRLQSMEFEWAMSTGDFEAFGSTREAMENIMKALKDDEVSTIGVYGMGGVGKTTLVKNVGAQACKIGIFEHVIMAVISQSPDLLTIQGTLADLLGVKLVEQTEMGRAAKLNKEIRRRNKILIILDDVWNRIELSSIGIPNYDKLKACNSKLMITTRKLNICRSMDSQASISLNLLSEEDSWNLFLKKTGKSFEISSDYYDIGRKVAKECCGLPIALIAVARAIGDKNLVEWEKASQRLEKCQFSNLDDEGDAFKCIKLSYDYLKDEDCKLSFLLCCLFPEDYNIPISDLFKYGYGKGLFRDADTIKEARETADSVVLHLKNSSLLMDSERDGCIRMHDVIRDTATKIAQDKYLVRAGKKLGYHWPDESHEGYYAVSLMGNNITHLPERLVFPKLQILLLQSNKLIKEIPETFFQSPNELRVLDLSATSISSLPRSWSLLTNLQALYLDDCKLVDDISIVGKLDKLHILSMRGSSSKMLPREIGDLINLKIFDITFAKVDRIPSKVISKLHKLEELYLRCAFRNWGKSNVEGEEPNASFQEVIGLLNLTVLEVCISDAECIPKTIEFDPTWVKFDITISKNLYMVRRETICSRHVEIKTITTLPEWFFNLVIFKAERLIWTGNLRLIDVFVGYKQGRFQGLKELQVGTDMPCEVPIFHVGQPQIWHAGAKLRKIPVLENLDVLMLYGGRASVEELHLDVLPPGSLLNLKVLTVDFCWNWGNVLFPAKLLKRLPNLEKLRGSCKSSFGTEYVFECEDSQPEQTKPREMNFSCLDGVRSMFNGPAPPAMFQNLKRLCFEDCKQLSGSLFTSDIAQCLHHLETFDLWECPLIQRIFEASNKKNILPKLKSIYFFDLPKLCYDSATIDFECPLLERLTVSGCPQWVVSISDLHSKTSFQELDEN